MTVYERAGKNKKHTARKYRKRSKKPSYRETKANNEASVRTNAIISDVKYWVKGVKQELAKMNKDKKGRPYVFCDSIIRWIAAIICYNGMTLRKAAGFVQSTLKAHNLPIPHYSTIMRRMHKMVTGLCEVPDDEKILAIYVKPRTTIKKRDVAVDSTGLVLNDNSLWRENKWGVGSGRRGWLKLHALTDIDSNEILAFVLTFETVGDSPMLQPLVRSALEGGHRIKRLFADSAYEAHDSWIYLTSKNIKFVVRFKSNTSPKSNGSMERGESAKIWVEMGPEEWTIINDYGLRWKVESAFSDFKRLVGEHIRARSKLGRITNVVGRTIVYNLHQRIRANVVSISGRDVLVAED